jgi:hypothetical protein
MTVTFTVTERVDPLHHQNASAHSTTFVQAFLAKHNITWVYQPPCSPDSAPYDFWFFQNLSSPLHGRGFANATITQYTSCQRCLTADWLTPRESDCSRVHSKVSSDWLPSYIKATRPVLEVFKIARYFPGRLRTLFKAISTSRQLPVPKIGNINKITFWSQQTCKHVAMTLVFCHFWVSDTPLRVTSLITSISRFQEYLLCKFDIQISNTLTFVFLLFNYDSDQTYYRCCNCSLL